MKGVGRKRDGRLRAFAIAHRPRSAQRLLCHHHTPLAAAVCMRHFASTGAAVRMSVRALTLFVRYVFDRTRKNDPKKANKKAGGYRSVKGGTHTHTDGSDGCDDSVHTLSRTQIPACHPRATRAPPARNPRATTAYIFLSFFFKAGTRTVRLAEDPFALDPLHRGPRPEGDGPAQVPREDGEVVRGGVRGAFGLVRGQGADLRW
jgi:hypothetical protein